MKANNQSLNGLYMQQTQERDRIKEAAAKMNLSASKFMLECIMEQVASIEETNKKER